MADLRRTLEIIFEGTDHVGGVVKGISGSVDKLAGSVGDITQPLADFTTNLLKVEGAIIAVGTAYSVYAFNSAKKFESAQIDLQKVLGDGAGDISQYDDLVFELSNTYGIAAADILQSAANFKQSGFTVAESFDLVKVSLDQAIAGEIDFATSSELLVATLKGFKAPASEAARLVDILNETSNTYATNLGQLAIGMAKFSPIASKMGLSFEETAGILTPVIEVFRSGDEAAIALRTGLLKLIDDTAPVKEALAAIGVSQTDSNGALRSGKDILFDVATAFQSVGENQKLFLTQQLVGIQQSAKMVEVFDGLALSQDITATAMKAAGSAAEEVAIRLASAEIAVERAKVGFENLATVIGLNFKDEIKEVINGVTLLEIAMQEVVTSGGLQPLFAALSPQILNISNLLKAMAENLPAAFEGIDFTKLVNSFGGLGDEVKKSFEAFFGPVDLSTVEGLQKVIQSIIDGIATLTEVSGGIVKGFKPFLEQLGKLKDAFFGMDDGAAKAAGNILGMATAINTMIGPLQSALGAVSGLGTAMQIMAGVQVVKLVGSIAGGGGLTAALAGPAGMAAALGATFLAGQMFGDGLRAHFPIIDEWANKTANIIGQLLGQADIEEELNKIKTAGTDLTAEQIEAYRQRLKALEETPAEVTTKLVVTTDASVDPAIEALLDDGTQLEKEINISVAKASAIQAKADLADVGGGAYFDEATGTWTSVFSVEPEVDSDKAAAAKAKIDQDFALKTFEIETEFEIAELEAFAETAQKALEFKAEVDIAEIEASAKIVESLGRTLDEVFASSGDIISSLFDDLVGLDISSGSGLAVFHLIKNQLEKENSLREKSLLLQEKLVESQTAWMDAKTDQLNSGGALLSVSAEGLYPELDMILIELVKRFHIMATAEGAELLVGL